MNFREFATNYLNPFFLFYRTVLLALSGGILLFSLPIFTSSASSGEMLLIFLMSLTATAGLYVTLRHRPYILYLLIPIVLLVIGFAVRGGAVVGEGVLILPMAMWWIAAFLLGFNGFRSWGYGISLNEINEKLSNR